MARVSIGEATVRVGKRKLVLRLDWDAIEEIEEGLDLPLEMVGETILATGKISRISKLVAIVARDPLQQSKSPNDPEAGRLENMEALLLLRQDPEQFGQALVKIFKTTLDPQGLSEEKPAPATKARKPRATKKTTSR